MDEYYSIFALMLFDISFDIRFKVESEPYNDYYGPNIQSLKIPS